MNIFIIAYLAHRVFDVMTQPKWVALRKSEKGRHGAYICTGHVMAYAGPMFACLYWGHPVSLWLFPAIFIPHWIIDRWSLADKWNGLVGGRTFAGAAISSVVDDNNDGTSNGTVIDSAWDRGLIVREFDIAFTAVVYKDVDETMHLLCLAAAIWWFGL